MIRCSSPPSRSKQHSQDIQHVKTNHHRSRIHPPTELNLSDTLIRCPTCGQALTATSGLVGGLVRILRKDSTISNYLSLQNKYLTLSHHYFFCRVSMNPERQHSGSVLNAETRSFLHPNLKKKELQSFLCQFCKSERAVHCRSKPISLYAKHTV